MEKMSNFDSMGLEDFVRNVYEPAGMKLSEPIVREMESVDYGACRFGLNGKCVVFRVAKTTPTKVGQFATLWKRPLPGSEIAPLSADDPIDFVVMHTSNEEIHGQFIFDKDVLIKMGVLSSQKHAGKRAIRVYPPWSNPVAKEAVKTQRWQLQYFLKCAKDGTANLAHTRELFGFDQARDSSC